MARITTNTANTQPIITINTSVTGANCSLVLPYVQDVTITNSTGVYSFTTFDVADQQKLSTPANNEVSTNIVIDDKAFFGDAAGTSNSAMKLGVLSLSSNKTPITFSIHWAGNVTSTDPVTTGAGFLTNIAAKTSPTAPVWVTPLNIAVDGTMVSGLSG